MIRLGGVTALAVALLSGPAPAAAAPDDRAAAAAFADAARAYTQEVWSGRPALDAAVEADAPALADCRAFDRNAPEDLSPRTAFRTFILEMYRTLRPVYVSLVSPTERLVAGLDAAHTSDPALRSARAVWRSQLGLVRLLAAMPDDTCAQLRRWAEGGAKGRPLPGLDLRGYDDPLDQAGSAARLSRRTRRLSCAAARLRGLGQGPRRAWRITGEPTDRALFPVIVRLLLSGDGAGASETEIERVPYAGCGVTRPK